MKQTLTWIGFCATGTLTRAALHFFPSAGGVSAPHAVQCSLTLFSSGNLSKSVVLDGARLSQPDGVWLDDAFPELRQSSGFVGVLFELRTTQSRTDITPSQCIMEFHAGLSLARFSPPILGDEFSHVSCPLIKDAYATTSIIIANSLETEQTPSLLTSYGLKDQKEFVSKLNINPVPAQSVVEVALPPNYFDQTEPTECSWGLVRFGGICFDTPPPSGVVGFLLYRDPNSGQVQSVSRL